MAAGRNDARPKLSFNEAARVCREFVQIGDKAYEYADQLAEVGFSAFLPFEEFIVSFAESADEVDLHRRCVIEMAKTILGNPWPLMMVAGNPEELFRSPLLQQLRAERDEENGVPENQLSRRYSMGEAFWRSQFDPCERQKAYYQVTDRELYDARWTAIMDAMTARVQDEAEHFASDLSREYTFDQAGRYALFTAVMERDATPLGFQYDKRRSRPNFPVFTKAVSEEWDLCWAIEEPNFFLWNPSEGRFEPFLEIRSRQLRGGVRKAKPSEFLQLEYKIAVSGFHNAYRTFHGLDELETLIKAHLCLYSLMAPIIEAGLKKILPTIPGTPVG